MRVCVLLVAEWYFQGVNVYHKLWDRCRVGMLGTNWLKLNDDDELMLNVLRCQLTY